MSEASKLPLVAAMTGQDPDSLVPGAVIHFAGVTTVGLGRMRTAGVEMAMPRPMAELLVSRALLDGVLAIDGYGRPSIVFEAATFEFNSRDEALGFLVATRRAPIRWAGEYGSDVTFVTVRFDNEELIPA